MKKILFFILIFLAMEIHAQNYMITFAGTGASTIVDSVKVENLTQCKDTIVKENATLNLSSTVGINTFNDAGTISLNIFPNPTTGSCNAIFEAPVNGNTTIAIYDAIGKRVAQIQQYLLKGQHTFNIRGTGKGVFLLKIQSEKFSCTSKLISNNEAAGIVEITEIPVTSNIPYSSKIKGGKNVVAMLYYTGDLIKFTGYSGIYKTIFMLVPTQNQTVTFNFVPCTDADGNHYGVVKIDTVVWMEENLKTTKFQNGNLIPNITNTTILDTLQSPAYSHYNNDITLVPVYGELYNWYAAADPRNICPAGWHVPEDTIWLAMESFLGGYNIVGGKIKENCSNLWMNPNTGATNETGFTGLPAGWRSYGYPYTGLGTESGFWTSTPDGPFYGKMTGINNIYSWITNSIPYKTDSYSMRCIKN